MRQLSPRLELLLERFRQDYAELGSRLYTVPEDAARFGQAALRAYRHSFGQPPLLRRAAALEAFATEFAVRVAPHELLVGRQTFTPPHMAREYPQEALAALGYATTTGHIVHDYGALLRRGIGGLRRELAEARRHASSAEQATAAVAFERALEAFRRLIRRYTIVTEELAGQLSAGKAAEWWQRAGDLIIIAEHPPQSFAQALQLVWFAQVFLHAENPAMAISFGRLDQYLWPFLRADLDAGRLTDEQAFDLVCAFCLKCCEGEESQNLTLGGVDEEGREAANPLSVMLVEAMGLLRCHQPSLTVRWQRGQDPASPAGQLQEAACLLAASGTGQPGFMNDGVVTAALRAVDIPLARARDWGVVGCYEAVPQGDCYPNTTLGGLHLPQAVAEYLTRAAEQPPASFEEFRAGFQGHLEGIYQAELRRLQSLWDHLADQAPSPFGSLLLRRCIRGLTPLEAGAAPYNLVGIDILGLGTTVDSLHAVRTAVYEQQRLSLPQLAAAVDGNFPEEALRAELQALPGRYGTDSPETNALAAELSTWLARLVLDSRLERGVRPYPAFFRFSADIYDLRVATPDGRRREDLISYGAGPSTGLAATATAVLQSVAHVAHGLAGCGAPLAVTLPAPMPPPAEAASLIRELLEAYFALGGMHLHFNTPSAEELREAQRHPQDHADLMIRVSGFSARFVRLDARWQDALIDRAEGN